VSAPGSPAARNPPLSSSAEVLTLTVRSAARRWFFWAAAALFTLLLAIVSLSVAGSGVAGAYLSPENAAPAGGRAVAEVLRGQGVDVRFTQSLETTLDAVEGETSVAVLLYDADALLDSEQRGRLAESGADIVLVNPAAPELRDLAPAVTTGEAPTGVLKDDCSVTVVDRAKEVSRATAGYRILDAAGATGCLEGEDGSFSLVELRSDAGTVTVLGAGDALTNEFVAERGNAALALGVLGDSKTLVWYFPGLDDVLAPPTLGELTPGWVTASIVLLALTALAAAFWRGRRLGPLVVENLPVVVRASETMEGRARLYQRSSARRRALDALRVGTVARLASAIRMGRAATVEEVAWAVAARTGRDPHAVRALLLDADPATDVDLVRLSDDLLLLESDLRAAIRAATQPGE
jgi:hypothetical protein